jgi:hypothetical protein
MSPAAARPPSCSREMRAPTDRGELSPSCRGWTRNFASIRADSDGMRKLVIAAALVLVAISGGRAYAYDGLTEPMAPILQYCIEPNGELSSCRQYCVDASGYVRSIEDCHQQFQMPQSAPMLRPVPTPFPLPRTPLIKKTNFGHATGIIIATTLTLIGDHGSGDQAPAPPQPPSHPAQVSMKAAKLF